jgi:integrase
MARGKGEGALFRVPKDTRQPLKYWQAAIELPQRNGGRRRKVIRSKDKAALARKLRELQKERDDKGDLETHVLTVQQWMTIWFETIAQEKIRPRTANTYRSLIEKWIIPAIGTKKLNKLTPDDVRQMSRAIVADGKSSTTALQAHRILAVALKYAEREGKVSRNVATLIDAPRRAMKNLRALTLDEALQLLDSVRHDRYGSLWAAVLLTGAREGELLGLQTDRVTQTLELSWQLQRYTWEHGCAADCGRKRGTDCPRRKITFPADYDVQHLTGGLWLSRPKSRAGWRVIPLVTQLRDEISNHVEATKDEPNPHNLVWHTPDGAPIDPREGNRMWHDVLDRAGVPQVRFHDGRHTAVDLLLAAGVHIDVVQEIVGHSSRLQTQEYKSQGLTLRRVQAMNSLGDLIDMRRAERLKEIEA